MTHLAGGNVLISGKLQEAHPALVSALRALDGVEVVADASETLSVVHDDTVHSRVSLDGKGWAVEHRAEGAEQPLPPIPGDATARLSTWLRAVPGALLVPEIDESGFEVIGLQHELGLGRLVQTFLDVEAARLASRGAVVHRIPMLPPTDLLRDSKRSEAWTGTFVTPTQSLLIQTASGVVVFLPQRPLDRFPATYARRALDCREAQKDVLAGLGFRAEFVDEAPIFDAGGLLSVVAGSAVWSGASA